jgi:hypothetical protein
MADAAVVKEVPVSAERVWAAVRDFGDVSWIPGITGVDVDGDGPGMRRHIRGGGDNPPVVERLISVDDAGRTIEYTIDENNPLPVASYVGTVTVNEAPGGSTIRWSAAYEPAGDEAEAAQVVEMMLGMLTGWLADAVGQDN